MKLKNHFLLLVIHSLTFLVAPVVADTETYLQSIVNAKDHADNPGGWIATNASMVKVSEAASVGINSYGLQYYGDTANNQLIVRTASVSGAYNGAFGSPIVTAGSNYAIFERSPLNSLSSWVTTGNEMTHFIADQGLTGSTVIKGIERGLGMNIKGSHDTIFEMGVVVGNAGNNPYLLRPVRNPDPTLISTIAGDFGTNASFPVGPAAAGIGSDTDPAAVKIFSNYKAAYRDWAGKAYDVSLFPWTQMGYTYYWGQTANPPTKLTDIQGLSEFTLLGNTGSSDKTKTPSGTDESGKVKVVGIYATESYLYTRNNGVILTDEAGSQYGNGFASFKVTGYANTLWAGASFQTGTKLDAGNPNTITIESDGSISHGQGVLVDSQNYIVTNAGNITANPDIKKFNNAGSENIALLFKGESVGFGAGVKNVLNNSGTITGPGVNGTAVQVLAGNTDITNTGIIIGSGSGYALKTGAGNDMLTVNGGFISGNIDLGTGRDALAVNAGSVSGRVTTNGPFTVNGGALYLSKGSVLGAGTFANARDTTLYMTGNTQIGSIAGGGMRGGNVNLGANTLTVDSNNLNPVVYAGAISGVGGALIKMGAGTQVFTGSSSFNGGTSISEGIMRVANGGALGTGAISNNATLDIGLAALNIAGDYTQKSNSTLQVAVSSVSNGSIVTKGTAVARAGYKLALDVSSYVPNNTAYKIIKGAEGSSIASPDIFISGSNRATFAATTIGDELILTFSRAAKGFASDAKPGDANAYAVGTDLDNIHNPSVDMSNVLNTMEGLSKAQTAAALDTLIPEVDAGVINTDRAMLNNFTSASVDRVEKVHKEEQSAYSVRSGVSSRKSNKLDGLWTKSYGSYLTQGMRGGIAGYNAWNAGTALGVDRRISNTITLGVSGGYAYGNVNSDANSANTTINSAQTTLYGGYQDQKTPFFINTAVSFAYNWYAGRRNINVGDALLRTANGSYDGQQYGTYLGGGYVFKFTEAIEMTPLVSLQYNNLHINSYGETGAGALSLNSGTQYYNQLQSGLGGRITTTLSSQWGKVTPELHSKWHYDFFGDPFTVTSNFNGGGAAFSVNGAKPAVNSFNVGGELKLDLREEIVLIGKIDTQLREGYSGVYGSFTVRF